MYIFTLHNIIVWSYFINYKCEDWICCVGVCCETIKSKCIFLVREESKEKLWRLTHVKGVSYLVCDLNFCKYISYRDRVWNSGSNCEVLGRDIMARITVVLISLLWLTGVSTCEEWNCVKQLKCLKSNITIHDHTA